MTREEAIKYLNEFIFFKKISNTTEEEAVECFKLAVKALQQQPSENEKIIRISKGTLKARTGKYVIYDVEWLKEHFNTTEAKIYGQPSEDCISRQAVLEITAETGALETQTRVKALPSVTPQQKTGHWIEPQQDDGMSDPVYYQVRCSECNFDLDPQTWAQELHQYGADKYCPRCGAKMQEEKK